MRNSLLKALVLFFLAVILLGMPLLLGDTHSIRPSSFRQIQAGMSLSEVERLLGAKEGEYDGYGPLGYFCYLPAPGQWHRSWYSRHGGIRVVFDDQDRVCWCSNQGSRPITWWARLWDRLCIDKSIG